MATAAVSPTDSSAVWMVIVSHAVGWRATSATGELSSMMNVVVSPSSIIAIVPGGAGVPLAAWT